MNDIKKVGTPKLELWDSTHPRWLELMAVIEAEGQKRYVTFEADFHQTSHLLVALENDLILGFLRMAVQAIGPDMDCPPLTYRGEVLTEAKILAFGVRRPYRRQGIGRALQSEAARLAKGWGCYQVRSHSDGQRKANHWLKVLLGFAVQPIIRGADKEGAYFILPLKNDNE